LLSVSDKRGIVAFATGLHALGWELVSTGGTAETLKRSGLPVTMVEEITGMPEMLDGRVKTLHPAVHGGLLARRDLPSHSAAIAAHGIREIDLVAVNLYPFRETIAQEGVEFATAIENIDIGGPAMLRSAAKNHAFVLPIVDPTDYELTLADLRTGEISAERRRELAAKVFAHLADYDGAIAGYLTGGAASLPERMVITMERAQILRYGENPQQRGALYVTEEPRGMRDLTQRHGKELSFNNLMDLDAATAALAPFDARVACVIVKHATPCGIAIGPTAVEAFHRARQTDPQSAFGGIVAFNTVLTREAAEAMDGLFLEVVVAPRVHEDAMDVLRRRPALRVVELPLDHGAPALDFKRVRGGFLVQDRFRHEEHEGGWRVVTERGPSEQEWHDLRFAWPAVAAVKSNAIVLAKQERLIGIGAGQMSRVDSVFLAVHKAQSAGHELNGSVLASDGFFPFADGVEQAAAAGVTAIIQPGGSVRDAEVVAAADRLGIAMVVTGVRSFRH
jgi:phosphoribosylaminoimidazolecarboxamide formyltransferase/IMP cyclohydrolase